MIFGNPAFGAQVVEIDPDRRWMAGGHGLNKAFRQMAGEGFNDDIAGLNIPTGMPLVYELDEDFKPVTVGGTYLDPEAAKAAAEAVANQGR